MQIASHAWRYALPVFALAPVVGLLSPIAGTIALCVGMFALVFHRDPERESPAEGIVSPADGRVSVVRREGEQVRVGIYMSVTDVHVNRAPLSGRVETVTHSPGANRPAFSKESDRNEKVKIDCGGFSVVQIAGAFARRIHPAVKPGDEIAKGERIGHISFGSRVDVVLPPKIGREDLEVKKGDRVVAGETVLVGGAAVGGAVLVDEGRAERDVVRDGEAVSSSRESFALSNDFASRWPCERTASPSVNRRRAVLTPFAPPSERGAGRGQPEGGHEANGDQREP